MGLHSIEVNQSVTQISDSGPKNIEKICITVCDVDLIGY